MPLTRSSLLLPLHRDRLRSIAREAGLLDAELPVLTRAAGTRMGDQDSRALGRGLDFEELALHRRGDDPRQIHAAGSLRLGRLVTTRNREQREASLHIVLDAGPAMRLREKAYAAFSLVCVAAVAATRSHLVVRVRVVDADADRWLQPAGPQVALVIEETVAALAPPDHRSREVPPGRAGRYRQRAPGTSAGVVLVISSFLGPTGRRLLAEVARFNAPTVLAGVVQDELEYSFPELPLIGAELEVHDPEQGVTLPFWASRRVGRATRAANQLRFQQVMQGLAAAGAQAFHVARPELECAQAGLDLGLRTARQRGWRAHAR